ncbi:MAG: hypothetical protein AMXMBFR36_30360 [Acidobacteriota bacterium]
MTGPVAPAEETLVPKLSFACALALLLGSAALEAQTCVPHLLGADRRGPAQSISRTGSTLYVGTGAALLVVDVTDRANPVERGYVNLDGIVRDVAAAGSIAVVLADSGLFFVDATDPEEPMLAGWWPIPALWYVRHIDARGTLVYLPAADGLHIVDFTDPAGAAQVGFLATLDSRDVVTRSPTRAYIVGNGSLHAIDISIPSAPTVVSSTALPNGADAALAIGPNGGRLAAWRNYSSHHPWSDVALFDLSDADQPVFRWGTSGEPISALTIAGDRAYIGSSIYRISNPAQPTWLGELGVDAPSSHAPTGNPDLLYVADSTRGVATMNVSDGGSVVEVDLVALPTETIDGYVAGGSAVILERSGLRVANLNAPDLLEPVGDLRLPQTWLSNITRISTHAVVVGYFDDGPNVMRLVDLANPAEPTLGVTLPTLAERPPVVDQNLLLAMSRCSGSRSVAIYDVSEPALPILVTELETESECLYPDLAADGDRLYVWREVDPYPIGHYVFTVFDISVPDAPVELARSSTENHWGSSVARGHRLVLTEDERLDVLDLADPATPVLRGSVPLRESRGVSTEQVRLYGSRAGLPRRGRDANGNRDDRPSLVDISDPAAPFEWAALDTPGTGDSIFFGPGVVVVADGAAGISIFESCVPFADGFESGDTSEWSLLEP